MTSALASRLDPEDLREVIGSFQRRVAEIVARFDGFWAAKCDRLGPAPSPTNASRVMGCFPWRR
jgi:hypothetical protein